MILAIAALAFGPLPPVVEPCAAAVVVASPSAASLCVVPASERTLTSTLPGPCVAVLERGGSYVRSMSSLADIPSMANGVRQDFERLAASCSAAYTSPPAPGERTTMQRLWD